MSTDILYAPERVKNIIAQGESHFREFKTGFSGPSDKKEKRDPKSVAKDIGETLVGFANADGGDLLIGVEDDGTITGLDYSEATIQLLQQAYKNNVHHDTPLQGVVVQRIEIECKKILLFHVLKNTKYIHQTSDGRCLQRSDKETIPVAVEQLRFERQEQISREYDRQFIDGASLSDLDNDIIAEVGKVISPGLSVEKVLQILGLAEYSSVLQLRRAALILFAKDIYKWHPRSEVRIIRISGTELKTGREYNASSDESARGNIIQLLSEAWEKLRPHLVETKFSSDALFKQRIMYPEDACREALTNALAHRDYSIEGRSIEINIFDDRMEIASPGELLSNISISDLTKLTGAHQSRNSFIARVLKEIGYMREMGEGIRRIFSLMKQNDLVAPEFESSENKFNVVLHSKSVFTDEDQRFLKGFDFLNLTREESLIVLLGKEQNLLSPQQIYDRLELVDWDEYRKIIDQIQIKGIVFNARSESEKAKIARSGNISKRQVERLKIRLPKECEDGIKLLTEGLKKAGYVNTIDRKFINRLMEMIPSSSIYYDNNFTITIKRLKFLNLIDNTSAPTTLLKTIWETAVRSGEYIQKKDETFLNQSEVTSIHNVVTIENGILKTNRPSEILPKHTLFFEGIDYFTTKDDLKRLLENNVHIINISIPINIYRKRGRGFAFVSLNNREEGESLMSKFNNTTFRGRVIRISWSRK